MVQTFSKRPETGKEGAFYLLCGVIIFFALIKVIFGKYLHDLLAFPFRISLKQKQLREQLLQAPLPSLLLNFFFIITGGIYLAYLLTYKQWLNQESFRMLFLYSSVSLLIIYLAKTVVLKLTGWVFNVTEATNAYIFIVFLINKLIGIFLIPVLLLLAFSQPEVVSVALTISYTGILLLFGYRYRLSYAAVRKEIKVSPFHFFLYLCAFELIPLVLIYRVLDGIL